MKTYEQMLKEALEKVPKEILEEKRLEIPEPSLFIEGNKTIINNFQDIADTIRRDPKHLARFLYKELAAPGHIEGRRLVLQSRIHKSIIEKKIDSYVKEFVLCRECGKPDTHFVKEGRITFLKCEACGAKEPVRNV
jgi:translation initiation factor 2 subunit 2